MTSPDLHPLRVLDHLDHLAPHLAWAAVALRLWFAPAPTALVALVRRVLTKGKTMNFLAMPVDAVRLFEDVSSKATDATVSPTVRRSNVANALASDAPPILKDADLHPAVVGAASSPVLWGFVYDAAMFVGPFLAAQGGKLLSYLQGGGKAPAHAEPAPATPADPNAQQPAA